MHFGILVVYPPDATAINGVVAWTQLPCSPPFASFLPRAPLLIWAHLPPQARQIKFLFQHWSGGVGGKQLTGSGRATLTFLSACQEQRLLARQHYFCSVCPQLRAGQPQTPWGSGPSAASVYKSHARCFGCELYDCFCGKQWACWFKNLVPKCTCVNVREASEGVTKNAPGQGKLKTDRVFTSAR